MCKLHRILIISLLFVLVSSIQALPDDKPLVIKGARVLTPEGSFLEGQDVLIERGKIKDLGLKIKVPKDTHVVEAQGRWLIPGLIDVFICPTKVPEKKAEKSDYFTPQEKILEVLDPTKYSFRDREVWNLFKIHREKFKEAVKSGVTTVLVIPDNTKIVSGLAGIFKLKHIFMEGSILSDSFALKIGFEKKGQTGLRSHIGIMWGIRELFLKRKNELSNQSHEKSSESQVFSQLFSKKLPALFETNTVDEMARALSLQDEFNLRAIFFGRFSCPPSYPLLAKKKIPVILSSPDVEATDEFAQSLKKMKDLGIEVALYSGENVLNPLKVLVSLKPWFEEIKFRDEDVYKFITKDFAKTLGFSERLGSIEKGKDADLILLSGDPLKPMTKVEKVFIDGIKVYDYERDKEN